MYRIGCGRPVTVAFRPLGSTELWSIGLLQMTHSGRSAFSQTEFVMRFVERFIVVCMLVLGLLVPHAATACSCADRPITERYTDSKFLLLVIAGPTIKERDNEGDEIRTWSFKMVEHYKGKPSFEKLWSKGGGASCGAHLAENVHYLISPGDDGRIGLCGTWRIGNDPNTNADIDLLNAYKAGELPELVEPWSFSETAETCYLSHQFTSGGGYLQFFYRFKKPEHHDTRQYQYPIPYTAPGGREIRAAVEDQGVHPSSTPGFMNLRVRYRAGRHVEENSGRVVIGDKEWRTRRTLMEAPWAFPYEVVDEEEAREILAVLAGASSVSAKWTLWELPSYREKWYPDYPDAEATTTYLYYGDKIKRFEECVSRGAMQD